MEDVSFSLCLTTLTKVAQRQPLIDFAISRNEIAGLGSALWYSVGPGFDARLGQFSGSHNFKKEGLQPLAQPALFQPLTGERFFGSPEPAAAPPALRIGHHGHRPTYSTCSPALSCRARADRAVHCAGLSETRVRTARRRRVVGVSYARAHRSRLTTDALRCTPDATRSRGDDIRLSRDMAT